MSTNTILKGSAVAAMTFAAMAVSASANAQSARYGNVADYERGQNCGQACVAPAPQNHSSSRYGNTVTHSAPIQAAPVYVDCRATGTCAPQPTTVYTQPAPVQYQAPVQSYSQPSYQSSSYAQAPANCPTGTTAQSDGTCLQSSYGSSSAYTAPATSYGSSTGYSSSASLPADCPAGTTAQSDGTCMQGSSYGSSTSYTAPATSYGSDTSYSSTTSAPANCPAGTTAQSDGTCMEGGSSSYASTSAYTGSSIELYTGDATTSSSTPAYGYTSEGSYTATDYLPIRK